MPPCIRPPLSRTGWPPGASRCWNNPPIRLTWPQPTFSCSPSLRRSWLATTCPRTTSRPSGRGSAGLSPPRTSPPLSGGGMSAARSVWTSEEAMLRNHKNKFRPISNTCVFIELVAFDFDCTTYPHSQKQNVFCLSILLFKKTIFKNFQFSEKRDLLSVPTVL